MAQLISCFECGKPVSSGASNCPHCKTSKVNGVDCGFCGIKLKYSQSVYLSGYYGNGFAHAECVQKVTIEPEPVEVRCSVCSYPTVYTCTKIKESRAESVRCGHLNNKCSNCGDGVSLPSGFERNTYGNCYHCNLLLKKSDNVQIRSYEYVHNYCYSLNRRLQDRHNKYIQSLKKLNKLRASLKGLHTPTISMGIAFTLCGLVVSIACFVFKVESLYPLLITLMISFPLLMFFVSAYTLHREPYLKEEIKRLEKEL
jgi:hypothetical protein